MENFVRTILKDEKRVDNFKIMLIIRRLFYLKVNLY